MVLLALISGSKQIDVALELRESYSEPKAKCSSSNAGSSIMLLISFGFVERLGPESPSFYLLAKALYFLAPNIALPDLLLPFLASSKHTLTDNPTLSLSLEFKSMKPSLSLSRKSKGMLVLLWDILES